MWQEGKTEAEAERGCFWVFQELDRAWEVVEPAAEPTLNPNPHLAQAAWS